MLKVRKNDPEPTPEGGGDDGEKSRTAQRDEAGDPERFDSGAVEVVLGVLIYFDLLGLLSNLHLHWRIHTAMGFPVTYMGAWLLYWCGKLWQQADDPEQWRQTVRQIEKGISTPPIITLVYVVGLIAAERALWKTSYAVISILMVGLLFLLFLPLLRKMRRL